jgi:hypothetical protein
MQHSTRTRAFRSRVGLGISCAAAALAIGVGVAGADQTTGPVSLDDLTRNALVIVEGTVDRMSSAWNDERTQIRTTVRIKADAFYKGDDGSGGVDLVLLGGVVGEDGLAVVGQPSFSTGERVLVFLRPDWKVNKTPVVAMEHGKFTIGGLGVGPDVLVSKAGERYSRNEVIATIRRINAAGTGGQP